MDIREYDERQQSITAALVALLLTLLNPFRAARLARSDWLTLLTLIYPYVEDSRRQSAELAREFYDSQRSQHTSSEERHDVFLAEYDAAWFEEAMRPERHRMSQPGAGDNDVAHFAMRAAKEVENGGRRTLLNAVESDPLEPRWARVATGRETCGFCLMLVSRGPVYLSAESAGLDLSETEAVQAFRADELSYMSEQMNKWHPGCDCKVVPVFDLDNWPGRDAHKRALEMWIEHTRGYQGKDALNALRRAVESGEITESTFAAAA